MADIPKEHIMTCPTCGKEIDLRDLGESMSHGNWNEETGKHECLPPKDIPYSSSRQVGDPVEWTKDKRKIDLN